MSEMESRTEPLPGVPLAERFSALLGRYLSINHIEVSWLDCSMQIEGHLVISGAAAGDPAAERRAMLDSLDALIGLVTETGVRWKRHPQLFIAGEVQHRSDAGQDFLNLEGRVTIDLWLPPDLR